MNDPQLNKDQTRQIVIYALASLHAKFLAYRDDRLFCIEYVLSFAEATYPNHKDVGSFLGNFLQALMAETYTVKNPSPLTPDERDLILDFAEKHSFNVNLINAALDSAREELDAGSLPTFNKEECEIV
jgi:hypothetical protein